MSPTRRYAVGVLVALVLAGCQPGWSVRPISPLEGEPAPSSVLVDCAQADTTVVLIADAHLDPSCTWTRGIEVRASGVTLDCRGARIWDSAGSRPRGVLVATPSDTPMSAVTVRNCRIEGFTNGIRVSREGFRSLAAGAEYDAPTADIVLAHNHIYGTRGSGIFVDGYTQGVTIRDTEIAGAGSVGVYLEAGSADNVVEDNWIHANGFGDVKPEGVPFSFGGQDFRYRSTGREGIAIDGSRRNVVRRNVIEHNSYGGIFLYKNCGEYVNERPATWWERRYGAEDNLIEQNTIRFEGVGIWVGSRMAENQVFMDCSDPTYVSDDVIAIHRDFAAGNVIRENTIVNARYGIRVEDDRTTIEGNVLRHQGNGQAVVIGSQFRTTYLADPVDGTVLTGNEADYPLNPQPFRWIHGHTGTVEAANTSAGAPSALTEGVQPVINPFLFVIDYWVAPGA